jgi:predicted outer membrane lipoprotein
MILHIMVISILCAAVAAFLILWYFWVKGKLGASAFLEDEDQVLFPFRYFSWILIGVILATCVAQIHFVRVSSTVHERMSVLGGLYERQELQAQSITDLKAMLQKVRTDMHANFQGLRAQIAETVTAANTTQTVQTDRTAQSPPLRKPTLLSANRNRNVTQTNGFAGEAKAASSKDVTGSIAERRSGPRQTNTQPDRFMALSREGRILTNHLRVRNRPQPSATVIEKLMSGQQIKVTGKRLYGEKIWYRIVTPSGRAGWVDFRYVKLEGNA